MTEAAAFRRPTPDSNAEPPSMGYGNEARTVLVTGGGGFIGRNLLKLLSEPFRDLAPIRTERDLLDDGPVRQSFVRNSADAIVLTATIPGHHNSPVARGLGFGIIRMLVHHIYAARPSTQFAVLGIGAEHDLFDVDDLCEVIARLLLRGGGRHDIYNATPDGTPDFLYLARLARDVAGADVPIKVAREGLRLEDTGDNGKLRTKLSMPSSRLSESL